jgi:O-antigen/teichoic acid export membrane protein
LIDTADTPLPLGPIDKPTLAPLVESGLRWALMRQVVTGLAGTVGMLAYTRLLRPEDLGASALAFLIYTGLLLLIQIPIRDAVVYYQGRKAGHDSAALWLLLAFSAAAAMLVMLLADLLGRFYRSPPAAGLTRGLAVAFVFQALAVVPAGLLLRRFRFAIHEGLQTVFILILFVGWIGLSASGFGPWSLVLPQIVGSAFWAISTWLAAGFRPILRPGRDAYRDILRFSRSLVGSQLIVYLKAKIDNAAVGTLGEGPLGWYTFGEDQSTFVSFGVGATVAQIALPAMAAVQDRIEDVRQITLDMLRLAATLSTPMQIGAIVLADLGISLFFGRQWLVSVPVFQAYLAFRVVGTLTLIGDAATSATGRPDIRLVLDLAQLPFFVAGVWFGLRVWGGISGVAWSLAAVRAVAGLVYLGVTVRVIQGTLEETFRYLMPSSVAGVAMGILVYGMRSHDVIRRLTTPISQTRLAEALFLTGLALAGAVFYFVILFALDRRGFKQVAKMAWQVVLPRSIRARLVQPYQHRQQMARKTQRKASEK